MATSLRNSFRFRLYWEFVFELVNIKKLTDLRTLGIKLKLGLASPADLVSLIL